LGALLVADSLKRIKDASKSVGVFAIVVDAKDENAVAFYKHFGFVEFEDNNSSLFLPMSAIP
jgi:hypothetical protein